MSGLELHVSAMDELVKKARNGDEKAEQELFRELLVRFQLFAARKVDERNADEVAQQACVTILEKYRSEEFTVSFQAWAYGVLKMTVRQFLRDRGRQSAKEAHIPPDIDLPESSVPNPMLRRYLLECVRKLATKFRKYARIVNLHYQGYDTGEICQRLGVNREQYYVYVGRGRSMLRDCLIERGAL